MNPLKKKASGKDNSAPKPQNPKTPKPQVRFLDFDNFYFIFFKDASEKVASGFRSIDGRRR